MRNGEGRDSDVDQLHKFKIDYFQIAAVTTRGRERELFPHSVDRVDLPLQVARAVIEARRPSKPEQADVRAIQHDQGRVGAVTSIDLLVERLVPTVFAHQIKSLHVEFIIF